MVVVGRAPAEEALAGLAFVAVTDQQSFRLLSPRKSIVSSLLRNKKKNEQDIFLLSLSLFAKCFFSQDRAVVENDNFIEINVKARINKLVIANKIDFTFLSWGG